MLSDKLSFRTCFASILPSSYKYTAISGGNIQLLYTKEKIMFALDTLKVTNKLLNAPDRKPLSSESRDKLAHIKSKLKRRAIAIIILAGVCVLATVICALSG